MAGFLFRKQKQDLNNDKALPSVAISAPTTLQSATVTATPLYARFATASKESNGAADATSTSPTRRVSAPKHLGSQGRTQKVTRNDTYSLTTDGQRRNVKARDVVEEHPLPQPSFVEKPLPPPVPPADDKPTPPAPPAVPTKKRIPVPSQKPLPPPSPSSQSFLSLSASSSSKNSFSRAKSALPTPPSNSSSSVSDSQPKKIKRQWSTSTTSPTEATSILDSPAGLSSEDPTSVGRVPTLSSTSTDSISSSTRRIGGQGVSFERVMDNHHPETLNSNDTISVSSSFNSYQQSLLERGGSSASGRSSDRQSTPSIQDGAGDMTFLRPPASPSKPSGLRRGLPSPPSTPMGSNASSLSRASVVSAYQEFYPSHVITDSQGSHSFLDGNQQHPTPLLRNQSVAQPSPLSHPPANTPQPGLQNGIYERQSPHLTQTRNQQHLYPDHQASFTFPASNPVSSSGLQSNVSVPRGKPRIFAAREAQENGRLQTPPQQIDQNILQPPNRQSLFEEFSTPRSQFESLPEITPYGDVDYSSTSKAAIDTYTPAPEPQPPVHQVHSRKQSASRSAAARQDDSRKQITSPTPRTRKLSKPRQAAVDGTIHGQHLSNGSTSTLPGVAEFVQPRKMHKSQSKSHMMVIDPEPVVQLDEETIRNAGIPLDDDPFARVEGVKMLKSPPPPSVRHNTSKENLLSSFADNHDRSKEAPGRPQQVQENGVSQGRLASDAPRQSRKDKTEKPGSFLLDATWKKEPPEPVTMSKLLLDPQVLASLLQFLSFYEWCILLSLSKDIRSSFVRNSVLRETALERFLSTVGYSRWAWDDEPLSLSLQDLSDYMRGVSTPTHEYSRVAAMYIQSLKLPTTHREPSVRQMVQRFVSSTRAYNRVLLRLRAQAEKEATLPPPAQGTRAVSARRSPNARGGNASRPSSRAPSPAASHHSTNHHGTSNVQFPGSSHANASQTNLSFRSPLFKLRRAPLLRVFVPSPEGDWLSDKSVLECEAECKRAGVLHLLRLGDVVWDAAVGDEGNVGRLVWDGSYLIDLDYTYSAMGELPKYLPGLAFPPSYFHRVIRTGQSINNPIVHIDIAPWGQEIAANLHLLQDRVRTETPQGAYHNVMRWVHRSSFQLRPAKHTGGTKANRIVIPNTDNLLVDSGWHGTIVVETEGTNEALADLQDRCGPGAFPPQLRRDDGGGGGGVGGKPSLAQVENRRVFRILRDRSRPGEIWIRAVSMKERLV